MILAMTMLLPKDTPVRLNARLGLISHIDSTRFEEEVVEAGGEGYYFGPHPNPNLKGWHLIAVVVDGRKLFCPCAEGQFTATT